MPNFCSSMTLSMQIKNSKLFSMGIHSQGIRLGAAAHGSLDLIESKGFVKKKIVNHS